MSLYAKIGNDQLIHRVSTASFYNGEKHGSSFCRITGPVILADTNVATCQICRNIEIKNSMERLNLRRNS